MVLHIQYHNNKFDYINCEILDQLINTRRIKRFYRPSEEKWVVIGIDPIRGNGGDHEGKERRLTRYSA
jgi:hypothetical protein